MTNTILEFDLEKMVNKVTIIKEKIAQHRDELRDAIMEIVEFTDLLDTSVDDMELAETHLIEAQQGLIDAADTLSEQV